MSADDQPTRPADRHAIEPGVRRGYSWPPFEKGHELSIKHGAYSPRRYEPLALEILEATEASVSWWAPADRMAALAWARTEARVQLVTEWLIEKGTELDGDGEVLGASELLNRLESRAESLRGRLGLDPLSRARLGKDTASAQVDLARLFADLPPATEQNEDDEDDDERNDDDD